MKELLRKTVKLGWRYKGERPVESYEGDFIIDADNEKGYVVVPKEEILDSIVTFLLTKV
jgi:hypothetical protein